MWSMVEGPRTNLREGESKAIVFLGGGRITSALVAGLRLAGDEREIVVLVDNRGIRANAGRCKRDGDGRAGGKVACRTGRIGRNSPY